MVLVRERLARLIRESGLSQAEVARRLGKDRTWINRRLSGRADITAEELPLLAEALGVSVEEFYTDESSARGLLDAQPQMSHEEHRLDPPERALLNFVAALLELTHFLKAVDGSGRAKGPAESGVEG